MRVAYVTVAFPKDSETFACAELRALARAGTEISVHALLPAAPGAAALLEEQGLRSLPATHTSRRTPLRALRAALRHPHALCALLALIARGCATRPREALRSIALVPRALEIFGDLEQRRPDAVHLFWGHYPALIGFLVQRFIPDVVLSTSLCAYDLVLDYGPGREVAQRAGFVRTHARVNVPELVSRGVPPEAIVVAHRGVDLDLAAAGGTDEPRDPGLADQAAAVRLICAARLIPGKRVDLALRAFARVRARFPGAALDVLGDGPARDELASLARDLGVGDAVRFHGHLPQAEVAARLREAEVLLLPSQHEAERLPNIVKEAMLASCGCVVSRTPGIEELVTDGVDGFVVDARDVEAAADAAAFYLARGPRAAAMRLAASERIRADFDADDCVRPLLEGWERAFAQRRGARTRVLVVSATLGDGGAERFASTLLCGLDRTRFAPELCVLREGSSYALPSDVAIEVLAQRHPLHTLRSLLRLRRLVRRTRPDVVLSCGSYTSVFVGQALIGLANAPRWIARVGNDPARHPDRAWARRIVNQRLRSLYARADRVVANSTGLARVLETHYPRAHGRTTSLATPVDFDALDAQRTSALVAAHRRGAADCPPEGAHDPAGSAGGTRLGSAGRARLVAVGRLHPQKRPAHLLAALALLPAHPEFELHWCGDGPLRDELEHEAQRLGLASRVHWLGFRADVAAVMADATLVVSASAHEGLPTALIEAQGLGVPVVATRCNYGVDEVVSDGETGLLVAPNDPAALADAIACLLGDPDARQQMGKRAAERARERYDAKILLPKWQALLR